MRCACNSSAPRLNGIPERWEPMISTTNLCDAHGDSVQVVAPGFNNYGGRKHFGGSIKTVKVLEAQAQASVRHHGLSQPQNRCHLGQCEGIDTSGYGPVGFRLLKLQESRIMRHVNFF
jgi:hypothetical protein